MLEELYQELILAHSKNQRNRGALGEGAQRITLQNPLCGDEIHFSLVWEDGKVKSAKFDGSGCSISQASASLLADLIQGRDAEGITRLTEDFRDLLKLKASESQQERLGDLVCLSGVSKYPARVRCAMLAFDAVNKILESGKQSGTESVQLDIAHCTFEHKD